MARKKSNKTQPSSGDSSPLPQRQIQAGAMQLSLDSLPKVGNPALPVIWIDSTSIAVRGDMPLATLRFYALLPEHAVETVRMQTTIDHLRALMDMLAKSIDYYPMRPVDGEKK